MVAILLFLGGPPQVSIVAKSSPGVSQASHQKAILGKWWSQDGAEVIEFFEDGTIAVVSDKLGTFVGNFRFVDESRMRIDIPGGMGALAGSLLYTVSISSAELELAELRGNPSRYRRRPPRTTTSGFESGARREAERYLNSNFTKCGDSHYLSVSDLLWGGIYQFKGLSIEVQAAPLDEATRLNGIEWHGIAHYKIEAFRRMLSSDRKVQDWRTLGSFDFKTQELLRVRLVKQKGIWNSPGPKHRKLSCASIPVQLRSEELAVGRDLKEAKVTELDTSGPVWMKTGNKGTVYAHNTPGLTQPVVLKQTLPSYTDEAIQAKIQGTILVETIVGKNGRATDFRILRGLGHGLDEKAIEEIAANWRFKPGRRNGVPVNVRAVLELTFTLR